MSFYLAIDTATERGSVAVGNETAVLAEVSMGNRRHASALLPAIEHSVAVAGLSYKGLTGIIVADGPGSFTGLRIGFATARGLMLDNEHLALYTAPSLMSLAFGVRQFAAGPIAALYDALRGAVFGAVYDFAGGRVATLLPPTLGTVTQLTELCGVRPSLGVGDGAALYAEQVREWTGCAAIGPPQGLPRAASLLELLAVDGARAVQDPEGFEPEYGRLAEAEVRLAMKRRDGAEN